MERNTRPERDETAPSIGPTNPFDKDDPRISVEPGDIEPNPILPPEQRNKTTMPSQLLVCGECAVFYECRSGWDVCPKCGEELTTVEKAD